MRKHIPTIFISFLLSLILCPIAYATVDWQINWEENGGLQEKVVISGQGQYNAGTQWQKSGSGKEVVFSRNVENWEIYNELTDKIPVQAKVKDLFCCRMITLTALPEIQPNTLYTGLEQNQDMRLKMHIPGIIIDSNAVAEDKSIVYWEINNPGTSFDQDFFLQAIMVDGLGLGITILAIGAIILAIFFAARMRKVNRLIDETYSLDNIVIEDEENNQQS